MMAKVEEAIYSLETRTWKKTFNVVSSFVSWLIAPPKGCCVNKFPRVSKQPVCKWHQGGIKILLWLQWEAISI